MFKRGSTMKDRGSEPPISAAQMSSAHDDDEGEVEGVSMDHHHV